MMHYYNIIEDEEPVCFKLHCRHCWIWHGFSETYMLVLTAAVSHSPATPTGSRPVDSWFRKWGWPVHAQTNFHG